MIINTKEQNQKGNERRKVSDLPLGASLTNQLVHVTGGKEFSASM